MIDIKEALIFSNVCSFHSLIALVSEKQIAISCNLS